MPVNNNNQAAVTILVDGSNDEVVDQFTKLSNRDVEVNSRSSMAITSFQRMCSIWSASSIRTNIKFRLFNRIVLATTIYARETWTYSTIIKRKLNLFHQRCLKKILKISWQNRITNVEGAKHVLSLNLSQTDERGQLDTLYAFSDQQHTKAVRRWIPSEWKRIG